jgi:hypothetical protein
MTKVTTLLFPGSLRVTVLHVAPKASVQDAVMEAKDLIDKSHVVLRCPDPENMIVETGDYEILRYTDEHALGMFVGAVKGLNHWPELGKVSVPNAEVAFRLESFEDSYGLADKEPVQLYKRMVELYQAGAIIEYHDWPGQKQPKSFHTGFRYDCMSDDDYFELQALEKHFGIKAQPNWRGDIKQRARMAG